MDTAGSVITAIAFLSPWNKIGERGRSRYVAKQLTYLSARINLVEVDLVRQGSYVLAAPNEELPDEIDPDNRPSSESDDDIEAIVPAIDEAYKNSCPIAILIGRPPIPPHRDGGDAP